MSYAEELRRKAQSPYMAPEVKTQLNLEAAEVERVEDARKRGRLKPRPDPATSTAGELVGWELRRLRVQRGHTQAHLARVLDVSQETYSRYERGGALTVDDLNRAAQALGMPASDILRAALEEG